MEPHVTSMDAFSYTTNRTLNATNKEVLLSPKYQKLFATGKELSAAWSFCIEALAAALAMIAKDLGIQPF